MSGIYIHIPFCKQACHYCNFHFSTSLKYKKELLLALKREIDLRAGYLDNTQLDTIYFGGGTPSLLEPSEISSLIEHLASHYSISPNAEITLEANPDDLSPDKLQGLCQTPVNRLSIGIQSFSDTDLQYMNRAHNANEAITCLQNALGIGFTNLSIDLIYGTPTLSQEQWQSNLATVVELGIPHISAYCLTVEPKTALQHFIEVGKAVPVDEIQAEEHFQILTQTLAKHGYQHYEISNFCLPGHIAKHNSSYWTGKPYLGIGPSAHSFNGISRQWNVANNALYLKAITQDTIPAEVEVLSVNNRFNEYLMTTLRTSWGCQLTYIESQFGESFLQHLKKGSKKYIESGKMNMVEEVLYLLPDARFTADAMIADLFI